MLLLQENIFQKLKILEILIPTLFSRLLKNGIYMLEHYIMHLHTKFQAASIFGSHLTAPKRR